MEVHKWENQNIQLICDSRWGSICMSRLLEICLDWLVDKKANLLLQKALHREVVGERILM